VLERSGEALPEARRPREPALDARLQRRPRSRLAQGLLEQRDRPVEALELGEEGERLGAQRTDVALCQQVREDRAGARPFSGGPMRTSRGQGSTRALSHASDGVSRTACSASSAATADSPRSTASVAASSSTAAISASGASADSARWRARAIGSSTIAAMRR
jgi:hypothetical protein